MPRTLSLICLLLTALLPALATPAPARACAIGCTPIHLILTYLPGLSNWGPDKATGVTELILGEGEARGRVAGLPTLSGERYTAWLVNDRTDEALSFGSFNTDVTGRAQFRFILDEDTPNRPWNLFLITVEPGATGATARQGDRRSIGSFFPDPDATKEQPRELPNTGGSLDARPPMPPSNEVAAPTTPAPTARPATPPTTPAPGGAPRRPAIPPWLAQPSVAASLLGGLVLLLTAGRTMAGLRRRT